MKKNTTLVYILTILTMLISVNSFAEDKDWVGDGDGVSWEDSDNWSPSGKPGVADAVTVNDQNAEVSIAQTFSFQSLNVGGGETSQVRVEDFISGSADPIDATNDAIHVRKDGVLVLTGEGVITLKGIFRNTETQLETEPAFMFTLE